MLGPISYKSINFVLFQTNMIELMEDMVKNSQKFQLN